MPIPRHTPGVIKTLSLIKRRPDLDRAAFRDHYESIHAPLALPLMRGLERYVRYHVDEVLHGEILFDVLTAFWYRDAEATREMLAQLDGEAGKAIREDELTFMDKPANTFFTVSERRLQDGIEGDSSIFVLVAKPEEMTRLECSRQLVRDRLPGLLQGLEASTFVLLRDAFPVAEQPLPWNAVVQIGADRVPALGSFAKACESEGYRVASVRTRRFETDLESRSSSRSGLEAQSATSDQS